MQENMVLEQEQLLMAIDDIDDAQLVAESAVIGKIADMYLRQAMIQESMTDEEFENFYFESSLFQEETAATTGEKKSFGEKLKSFGSKIKNSKPVEILKKLIDGIINICKVIGSKIKKFFSHLKPSYIKSLIRCKNSAIVKIAKSKGCKVRVEDDRSWTLLLPFLNIAAITSALAKAEQQMTRIMELTDKLTDGKHPGGTAKALNAPLGIVDSFTKVEFVVVDEVTRNQKELTDRFSRLIKVAENWKKNLESNAGYMFSGVNPRGDQLTENDVFKNGSNKAVKLDEKGQRMWNELIAVTRNFHNQLTECYNQLLDRIDVAVKKTDEILNELNNTREDRDAVMKHAKSGQEDETLKKLDDERAMLGLNKKYPDGTKTLENL